MTEDEAKTKWCPFVRLAAHYDSQAAGTAGNRWSTDDDVSGAKGLAVACIASACMAWRTRHQWLDNAQQEPDWVSYAPYAFEPGPGQERDDGFCGLAGAPS